jgi:tetratricopeptide (TPR) repeat protein
MLADLLQRVPPGKESRMSSAGFAAWVCWQEALDPAVAQTLQDYGGMSIAVERDQSLWFFFTLDVLLALARLCVWAKFNNLKVAIVVFPAKLVLGNKRELGLTVETSLSNQALHVSENLDIWLHPKLREHGEGIPGLSFEGKTLLPGMAKAAWLGLNADPRLPYTSSQGWYAIVRPLGNPLDKLFQAGWRAMYVEFETLLKQHKLKYLLHENVVSIQIENLRQLRQLLREIFAIFKRAKDGQHDYWPCVCAVVDRKGLNFNAELVGKVGLQWENLTPDYPYMSYRTAYLLGEGFTIFDIRFSSEQVSMDTWCNISLDENVDVHQVIPITMPGVIIPAQESGCYYCGFGGHSAAECPTRSLPVESASPWHKLAALSFDDMNEAFRRLAAVLTEKGTAGYGDVLEAGGGPSILLRALFDINAVSQLRSASRIWLAKSKDYPRCLEDAPHPRDGSPVWELLEQLSAASSDKLGRLEKEIQVAIQRLPRDGRLRTLLGFCHISNGNPAAALVCFREGAALTHSTLIQAWNEYLQARTLEIQGHHTEAFELYGNVQRLIPSWTDVQYRLLVCKIKLGFGEQALDQVRALIAAHADYFNRCLIDPELERGQLLILSTLYPIWMELSIGANLESMRLQELSAQIDAWYPSDHPTAQRLGEAAQKLRSLAEIKNYAACLYVRDTRPELEKDVAESIQKEIELLQAHYKHYLAILQNIRDEASWFPFPGLLVVFNKEFNECANIINWAFGSNFKEPEVYKKAHAATADVAGRLQQLKKRLGFLRMVRDTTLFGLTMGKTFFWVEVISLLLCLLLVPGIVYFGHHVGLGWLQTLLAGQLWEIQKVLVLIVTVVALGIAALRSTLIFEKRRDRFIAEAKEQREKNQQMRLERIRQQRRVEAETKTKAEAEEARRQQQEALRQRMQRE